MFLAVISFHQAVDLFGVVGLVSLGAYSWTKLDRREKRRRVERKEKQAAFTLERLRREREYDSAMRYRGGVVR